jgi:cytochrome c-type biogenesis protein
MILAAAEGWLIYPFTLGLLAAVNPCGFPLLPAYLGLFVGEGSRDGRALVERGSRAMLAGACATIGFVVVFGGIGILVEAGLFAVYDWARWAMIAIGVVLTLVGLLTLAGRQLRIPLPQVRPGLGTRRPRTLVLFGVSYGIASLGCALPLFLAGVGHSFTRLGVLPGMATFLAYALGMGLVLTVLSLLVAVAGTAAAARLRVVSRLVRPLEGALLTVVGAYLTLYWISAVVDPTRPSAPIRFVDSIQGDISGWFVNNSTTIGATTGAIVITGLAILALAARPTPESPTPPSPAPGPSEHIPV